MGCIVILWVFLRVTILPPEQMEHRQLSVPFIESFLMLHLFLFQCQWVEMGCSNEGKLGCVAPLLQTFLGAQYTNVTNKKFLDLVQGLMSVFEYDVEFIRLSESLEVFDTLVDQARDVEITLLGFDHRDDRYDSGQRQTGRVSTPAGTCNIQVSDFSARVSTRMLRVLDNRPFKIIGGRDPLKLMASLWWPGTLFALQNGLMVLASETFIFSTSPLLENRFGNIFACRPALWRECYPLSTSLREIFSSLLLASSALFMEKHLCSVTIVKGGFLLAGWRSSGTNEPSEPLAIERWTAPLPGMIKVNVDDTCASSSTISAIGILAMDNTSLVLAGHTQILQVPPDPSLIESHALCSGIRLALSFGPTAVVIESDALNVVQQLQHPESDCSVMTFVWMKLVN
ncbi:hypothetical protein F3Y22_tig00113725pilonHSYRG00492 [Hibiscus syriacus]|uniref:RNase H type-1 domain-containing protein n=1 Tax=Hibiscus syriacus TaxID=106335 RepID=A0A6A2XSS9_HIBSY|nr:hypothetical protein F3Y22_tig00113725pilonHSYRG00492 [Hibiscus syriacus]